MTATTSFIVCALAVGVTASTAAAAPKSKGDPAKGKAAFEVCSVCHNVDSTEKKMGPGLKGLFHRPKLQNGQKVTEQTVRAQIDAGGNGMPAYKDMLTEPEKDDLIAYLKSL